MERINSIKNIFCGLNFFKKINGLIKESEADKTCQ